MPLGGGSRGVLGPALFFSGIPSMAKPANFPSFDAKSWSAIVEKLQLSPQQSRIVALILHGACDKQIAGELKLTVPTVRSHLGRVFQKNAVKDRVELILRVFAISQSIQLLASSAAMTSASML